jgi:ABC-2 type transport system permease protein
MPVKIAATILPFRWMVSFPVELFLGQLTPIEAAEGILAQVLWVGIAFVLLRIVWQAGVRVYSAVGA